MPRRIHRWIAASALGLALLPVASSAATNVAPPFQSFYRAQQGLRVLGNPIGKLETADGYYAQYFEKGRIEDHRAETSNRAWQFMYARLAAELIAAGYDAPIGGDTSSLTYATLRDLADPSRRVAPPRAGVGGPIATQAGVFVPYDSQLNAAPGHLVTHRFWDYINRRDLFPGGWLHDIGLPMTEAVPVTVSKAGVQRTITVQAFERAILTDDPQNPRDWQIERDNIGVDHRVVYGPGYADGEINAAIQREVITTFGYTVQIQRVEGSYARARLYPLDPTIDPAWVWLRREGSAWQVLGGGPGTAFDEDYYRQQGIPSGIWIINDLEHSLDQTVDAYVRSTSVVREFGLNIERIEGGWARLRAMPIDVTTDPAYIYARLDDVNRWTPVSIGTAFDVSFYLDNQIPTVLWLPNQ